MRNRRSDVCSVADNSGNIVSTITFDPWGRASVISGSFTPDFTFASMYWHEPSGLSLTSYRAYSSAVASWLSRDPLEEGAGTNLYLYAAASPFAYRDPLGLQITGTGPHGGWMTPNGEEGAVPDPIGDSILTGLGGLIIKLGRTTGSAIVCCFKARARSGLGDLTNAEVAQIQKVVDAAGRPLNVVGSAARGARTAASDIDYTTANSSYDYFKVLQNDLPCIGKGGHTMLRGAPEGPSIRFEPGQKPFLIP